MHETISLQAQVDPEWAGMRVDQIAAVAFPDYSRSRLKKWIEEGDILVNGEQLRPREKLYGGEKITLECKIEIQERWQPEPIDIDIVYEDDDIMIINKAAGLVVHPAAGHHMGFTTFFGKFHLALTFFIALTLVEGVLVKTVWAANAF